MAGVLLAALVVKAVVLAQLYDHPLLQPQGSLGLDTEVYFRLAHQVLEGRLDPAPYYVAPLYLYFLALCFQLGASLLVVKGVQIALGVVAVFLVMDTARQWFSPRVAVLAGALLTATGILTFNEVLILQSALDPFLTALLLWLLTRALRCPSLLAYGAAGLSAGLLALNRPNAITLAPALALILLAVRREGTGRGRDAAALLAGTALALGPAVARNALVAGEMVPIASHGGLNFYIGNNPEADGTYHQVAGITPSIEGQVRDSKVVAERAVGRPLNSTQVSAYFFRLALDWIWHQPQAAARLFARKVAYTFNATDLCLNYSYSYYAQDEKTLLRVLVVGPALLFPLGLFGLADRLRERPRTPFAIWASVTPIYALSVAAFFVSSRYRLPLLLPMTVGAAGAVDRLGAALGNHAWRYLASAAGILGALGLAVNWDFGLNDGRSEERAEMVLHLVDAGRADEALQRLPRAAENSPDPALLFFRVGQALEEHGQSGEAVDLFRRAVAAEPKWVEARLGLARALVATGKPKEALDLLSGLSLPPTGEAPLLLALGTLALKAGGLDQARVFLSESVARAPGSALAHENLGLAFALGGRRREAIQELEESARLDPADASTHLNLAVVLAQEGRFGEARGQAVEALRLKPDYGQAQALLQELDRPR